MAQVGKVSASELAEKRTALAAKRTMMAAERSLLAWVRTAISMITFGFTIYKVLQEFSESGGVARTVGLFLIGMGTVSMMIGVVDYRLQTRELRRLFSFPLWRPPFVIALFMAAVGLLLLVSVISRVV